LLSDFWQLRKVAFAIKNSTTILLPEWFSILRNLNTAEKMIPRDVSTRWNSTFDMLDFAVEHITAINTITADRDMNLRKYELSEGDWAIARQLRDVLKVTFQFDFNIILYLLTTFPLAV
jgi:exoribonuclease II